MITLFKLMPESVVEWFVANSKEVRAEPETILIRENEQVASLYIVLSGVLGVYLTTADKRRIGTIGTGTVMGEISFVDDSPASATIIVEEKTLLLEVGRDKLNAKIDADPRFATAFYKALAVTLTDKLRRANEKFAATETSRDDESLSAEARESLRQVERFKELILQADGEILAKGHVGDDITPALKRQSLEMVRFFHTTLGAASTLSGALKERMGAKLQHDLLPHILLSETASRFHDKPRGYASDYVTVERIYEEQPSGSGRTGALIDKMFLDSPLAGAIRNRRHYFSQAIATAAQGKASGTTHVLGLAAGSAREIEDAFERLDDKSKLKATLLDLDAQALAFVTAWATKAGVSEHITPVNENLVNVALGRAKTNFGPQDLIYAPGLVDYFDDRLAVKIINFLHTLLAPGGRLILCGFHQQNVFKEFMEYIFDWHVHHREAADMDAIFAKSAFAKKCDRHHVEEESVFLFSECVK